MKKTIKYAEIKEITYKFSSSEIRDALIEKYKIPVTKDYVFEVFEEYGDEPYAAVLVMNYSTKVQE